MIINQLSVKNFRNIENVLINPFEEINVIYGENAQGKTNIIESIWLFTGAKSFRTNKDASLIKFNKAFAENTLNFVSRGINTTAKIIIDEKKQFFINNKKVSLQNDFLGNFKAIVFSPNDLNIVKSGPNERRRFLDIVLGQLYPNYVSILREYSRALIQRNKIIKDYKYDASVAILLDSFEQELVILGTKIINARKKIIEDILKYLPDIYDGISNGKEKISIKYLSTAEGNFDLKLKENRKKDSLLGFTTVGPHRDDIEFYINDINARNYGSQGQHRSIALSLKLAEAEVINKISGEFPVCLLDDVMSELDVSRQNYILNHIKGKQTFITCCDISNIEQLKNGKVFKVFNGGIL